MLEGRRICGCWNGLGRRDLPQDIKKGMNAEVGRLSDEQVVAHANVKESLTLAVATERRAREEAHAQEKRARE